MALVIAVPLGIISATRRNRLGDHGIRLLTMVTFAMPTFWLALMLVQLLSLKLDLLPVSGYGRACRRAPLADAAGARAQPVSRAGC